MNIKEIIPYLIESFAMLYMGINLFNHKITKKRIICAGILYAATITGIRLLYNKLDIPLGTHSIILLGLFSLYCIFICKLPILRSITMAYIGYILIIVGEWMVFIPLVTKLGMEVDSSFFNTWKGVAVAITADSLLIITGAVCAMKNYIVRQK